MNLICLPSERSQGVGRTDPFQKTDNARFLDYHNLFLPATNVAQDL